jgi:hypothetical protein
MTRSLCALAVAGILGFGVALADETPASPSSDQQVSSDQTAQRPAQQQFMKDCMTKARAANNGTSDQDMKKACKQQLKTNMGNPSEPVTPAH